MREGDSETTAFHILSGSVDIFIRIPMFHYSRERGSVPECGAGGDGLFCRAMLATGCSSSEKAKWK